MEYCRQPQEKADRGESPQEQQIEHHLARRNETFKELPLQQLLQQENGELEDVIENQKELEGLQTTIKQLRKCAEGIRRRISNAEAHNVLLNLIANNLETYKTSVVTYWPGKRRPAAKSFPFNLLALINTIFSKLNESAI